MKFRVPHGAYLVYFGAETVLEGCTMVEINCNSADGQFLKHLQKELMKTIDESERKKLLDSGKELIIRNLVRIGDVV